MEINLTLDVEKSKNRFTTLGDAITIRQGDGMSYVLNVDIRQAGEIFNLDGYTVRLYATKPNGDVVIDGENVQVVDAQAGSILYTIPTQLISERGKITDCYFRITENDWENSEFSITTESFALNVVKGIILKIHTGDYIPELDDLLGDLEAERNKYDDAEFTREENEEARRDAESARIEAENQRSADEAARREAEKLRVSNEEQRIANEDERVEAERLRVEQFEQFEKRASGWARYVCSDGEYDPISGAPIIENPSEGTLYYVPILDPEGQAEGNRYEEWTYTDLGWERLGAADMFYSAIGANEIEDVTNGEIKEGSAALTLSGLTKLWGKIVSKFADKIHRHNASDITDGVLDLSHGGTGADNATGALANLGGAKLDHTHALSTKSITGVLPVAKGGTGAGSVSDARKNLLVDTIESDTDSADTSFYLMLSAARDSVIVRTGAHVWSWIAGKIRSVFGFNASNVLYLSHGGTGASTRAGAMDNLTNLGLNPIANNAADTLANWRALGAGVAWFDESKLEGQPYANGSVLNFPKPDKSVVTQIFHSGTQGNLSYRGIDTNGVGDWYTILDSRNTSARITAKGSSGNWIYYRYSDGWVRQICRISTTMACGATWGNGFYNPTPIAPGAYPVPLKNGTYPRVQGSVLSTEGRYLCTIESASTLTTAPKAYICSMHTQSSQSTVLFQMTVEGWAA